MTLRLNGSTSGYTEIDAPAVAGSNTLVLPTGNGTNGQVLTTNGSGSLSWSTVTSSKILQVVSAIKTDTASTASTTASVITGLTVTLTPANSSNTILLMASISASYDSNDWGLGFYFGKNGSVITAAIGDAASNRPRQTSVFIPGDGISGTNIMSAIPMMYRDTAGGVSAITYSVMWNNSTTLTGYLNRMVSDRDTTGYDPRCISSLIAMEVAA